MAEHDENLGDQGGGIEEIGRGGGLAKATGSSDAETPEPGVDPSVIGSHFMGDTPSAISGVRRPAPESIGPYRVRGVLGEGGFGVVYLAEQEKPIRRQVAIKLLRAGRENDQVIARFQRERQSLVRMEHPGIARVFEASELPDGRPYIVMEFVKGLPLTTYCDDAKLSLRARLELVGQVCRAVQHAHTKGMIHRDLKPSNVLVAVSDGAPVVKIIDFGIAKPVEMHEGEQTVYTQLNQIVGTPGYMSPEQVRGSLDLDTRTDVYSIGVMLYELLAGALPLDPALFRNKTAAQAERLITETEPQRPSTRVSRAAAVRERVALARATDAEALARELRGELDWVVMKCLEKDPARRYQSPAELEQDLQRYLSGEAVEAVPPTLGYRARKYVRRHRALVVSVAAIVLALVGGLASAGYGLYQAKVANAELTKTNTKLSEAIDEVTRQEKKATREAARSGAFSKLFVDDVLGAASVARSKGEDLTVREVLDQIVSKLDTIEDPSVRGAVEGEIGEIYRALNQAEEAYTHLLNAVTLLRGDQDVEPSMLANMLLNLSRACMLASKESFGVEYAREAHEVFSRILDEDEPRAMYAAQSYAEALLRNGPSDEAVELLERIYGLASAAAEAGPECVEHAVVMSTYAQMVLMPRGLGEERFKVMTRVLEMAERLKLPDFDMARYLGMYGQAASDVNRHAEAAASIERAIEIERRLQEKDTGSVAALVASLANSLRLAQRSEESEAAARESVEIYERVVGPNTQHVAGALAILGAAQRQQKKYAEAAASFARAESIYSNVLGRVSWLTLNVQSLHGEAMIDLEQFDEAERLLLDAERGLRADANAIKAHELTMARLIRLYDVTARTAERDRWVSELERRRSASQRPKD